MHILGSLFVALVALLQSYFLVLEMFLWTTPFGCKTFGQTVRQAEASSTLAANQGLYNGFLAAGLVWALAHPDPLVEHQLRVFFLACVLIAGIYGGATANPKIYFVQALPALLALALTHF